MAVVTDVPLTSAGEDLTGAGIPRGVAPQAGGFMPQPAGSMPPAGAPDWWDPSYQYGGAQQGMPQGAVGPQQSVATAQQQSLGQNPMLPEHPLGAYTDAQYEADVAQLHNQISRQYADLLQQLGYHDENGNFIMGSVETEANRQRQDLQRSLGLATEDVTRQAQQGGTLFSGMRGTLTGRAQYPYANAMAQIASNLPIQLQKLYEQAAGLVNDYTLGQNQLLAGAAARRAAAITQNPPGPVTEPPGGSVGGPPGNEPPIAPGGGAPVVRPPVDTTQGRYVGPGGPGGPVVEDPNQVPVWPFPQQPTSPATGQVRPGMGPFPTTPLPNYPSPTNASPGTRVSRGAVI